jgi:hypothetical protein
MNIELNGQDEVDRRLDAIAIRVPMQGKRGAELSAHDLRTRSALLAPVDTGDLRGSASVTEIANGYRVSFGMRYAAVQHEGLEFNHPRGGQAKYLEQPLEENRPRYLQLIRDAAAGGLR